MALTGGTRQAIEVFKQAKYDHMDVETKQFDTDFYNFQSQIKELERRLASVIAQAFDDSVTVLLRFKLLDAFEGILERDVVQTDLENNNARSNTFCCRDWSRVDGWMDGWVDGWMDGWIDR